MSYTLNTADNLTLVFKTFKAIAWIDCRHFTQNAATRDHLCVGDYGSIRMYNSSKGEYAVPDSYINLLESRRYSLNTARVYVSLFGVFVQHVGMGNLMAIDENDIQDFLRLLVQRGFSSSTQNQALNAIKFYYERVLDMPKRFYDIQRPRQQIKLPKVLSQEDVLRLLSSVENLKHQAILATIYSCGLRISELINLKLKDIDSGRKMILVRDAKGKKDRSTILADTT
jgi:site-specific recombinase XerD